MEKRLENERKAMQEQLRGDVEQIEKEEQTKYERKLESMKREVALQSSSLNVESEIQQYRDQLEEEYELQIREYRKQLEQQMTNEEDKLDKKRSKELKEYENVLQDQFDADLKRKQQKLQLSRENEDRELELVKLRVDQMYQDQLEGHKRQLQSKYEKERRLFDDEKRKRLQDIQSSIDKLNIASGDKERLRQEIETLNREHRDLSSKVQEVEEELEGEHSKKRQLEREINDLSIQINTQKAVGARDESQRVVWLREELAKKQVEVSNAQRQYKELLEQKFEGVYRSPGKQAARGASSDNMNILKLEHEMKQIKEMLQQFSHQQKGGNNFAKLLEDIEDKENSVSPQNSKADIGLKEFVAQEKSELKELQLRLEEDKRRYKIDKKEAEDLRYSDPSSYRQRTQVLEKVKDSIERQIDKVNQRISKIKEKQK